MRIEIKPQPGPQTEFLSTQADIAFYGGAAGGGKSFGLLLDPLRHYTNARFGAVIFRKNSVQVRNEGGLWDESMQIYPLIKGHPKQANLQWTFPSGMSISFSHLEHEKSVLDHQGSQMGWMGFDEITHFSQNTFFYMLSRNRSASGVSPKIRATCNPDPDSWVRSFIDWWIGEDGYPIPERSGKLRYFIRTGDQMVWADSPDEIYAQFGNGSEIRPKSVTFIPSKLQDNKILMEKDPGYLGNLLALSHVDRMRLLEGNWNIRASAGELFKQEWFPIIDAIPSGWIWAIRFWDRAATKPHEGNKDPDWTRGIKLYKYPDGTMCVADLKSMRDSPGQVENLIKTVASHDTHSVSIMSQKDPGSAGVKEAEYFIRMLSGYIVHVQTISKDKITRAKPVSAQAEAGNIQVLRAPWNYEFFRELENFPDGKHDDIVDTLSGGFNAMTGGVSTIDAGSRRY